jgi:hypothetical protein
MGEEEKSVTTCEFCRYSIVVPDGTDRRICRRNPPIPVFSPTAASTDTYTPARWPIVEHNWWCGEFKTEV